MGTCSRGTKRDTVEGPAGIPALLLPHSTVTLGVSDVRTNSFLLLLSPLLADGAGAWLPARVPPSRTGAQGTTHTHTQTGLVAV